MKITEWCSTLTENFRWCIRARSQIWKQHTLKVTPEAPVNDATPRIGIAWDEDYGMVLDAYGKLQVVHPSPVEQIRAGMLSIVNTIGAIASPKSDVRLQHMGGPVMTLR